MKSIVIRKNRLTGNWVWRCRSIALANCFGRWGSKDTHAEASTDAKSHFDIWHNEKKKGH